MKKPIFLLITILFLIILPAILICRGISSSEDLSEVEIKIENLRKENNLLEKKLVQKTSSAQIFSEASLHGYEEALVKKQGVETVALKR